MQLKAAIRGRRAVRAFTDAPVADEAIRDLIDAAIQAPSAVNQQPWTFTVVRDPAVLDRLSSEAKQHMARHMPPSPHAVQMLKHLHDEAFHIFYHAPALILISAAAEGPWIVEDCALAAENLMLAAHAAGLGTCWIGFAQSFLATPAGRALIGIPAAWVPVAPIIVGHPSSTPPHVPRKEPEVRWVG
ncbi:MAG: nitroreductase [Pseudomonadota bacterium]